MAATAPAWRTALALVLLLLLTTTGVSVTRAATAAEEAASKVLQAHGLPRGLLPSGIAGFRHDAATGRFEAALGCPCTARFEVGLRYNATVSGVISAGRITAISGVAAQDLFMWFPVRGIHVDIPSSGVIYFDVGVVFKHFPLYVFDAPPPCTPDPAASSFLRPAPQRLEDGEVDALIDGNVEELVAGGAAALL